MMTQPLAPIQGANRQPLPSQPARQNTLQFRGKTGDAVQTDVAPPDWFSLIRAGHHGEIDRMIAADADVDQTLPDYTTGLILAVKHRFEALAHLLLEKKADPTRLTIKGKNALFYAVKTQNEPLVIKLIQKGANPNDPMNMKGMTLLMRAAKKGKADQVALLLKHGAKIAQRDSDGKTALMWAIQGGHDALVPMLLDAASAMDPPTDILNQPDNFGITPLMAAARKNQPKTLALLLARGADFNKTDDKGNTALTYAFGNRDQDSVRLLLNQGATVEGQPNLLSQALLEPEHYSDPEAFKVLLQKGGDPNVRDDKGQTPLIKATLARHYPAIELLLQQGALPNARDLSGKTAFMYAAKSRNFATMFPLLKGGADPCPAVDNEEFFEALDRHLGPQPADGAEAQPADEAEDDYAASFQMLFKEKDEARFPIKLLWPQKIYWSQDTRDAIHALMTPDASTE